MDFGEILKRWEKGRARGEEPVDMEGALKRYPPAGQGGEARERETPSRRDPSQRAANLKTLKGANPDQDAGIKIVLRAVEEPLRQIVANAGEEPSVVLNKVAEGKGNFGMNAATGEYGDMVEMGVLDPTKVTRYALQNAASVAGLMLTTDAMVAELPKDDKPAMPGGGMGGMGGMGDMDM